MKDFRDVQFVGWFENKLLEEPWNASAMVNDGFTYEVVRETEKAILIEVKNTHKRGSSWTIWAPKSAVINLEEVMGLQEENEEEKGEEIIMEKVTVKEFLKENGIVEYSREERKMPYSNGTFESVVFKDKENNMVRIDTNRLTQEIEKEVYDQFNSLYDNAYEMDLKGE